MEFIFFGWRFTKSNLFHVIILLILIVKCAIFNYIFFIQMFIKRSLFNNIFLHQLFYLVLEYLIFLQFIIWFLFRIAYKFVTNYRIPHLTFICLWNTKSYFFLRLFFNFLTRFFVFHFFIGFFINSLIHFHLRHQRLSFNIQIVFSDWRNCFWVEVDFFDVELYVDVFKDLWSCCFWWVYWSYFDVGKRERLLGCFWWLV